MDIRAIFTATRPLAITASSQGEYTGLHDLFRHHQFVNLSFLRIV